MWSKFGLIWTPPEAMGVTKAMVPTPFFDELSGELFLYVTCVNKFGAGRPYRLNLDANDPSRVIAVHGPLLDPGEPGAFDELGVMATSVVKANDGSLLMYYTGFQNDPDVRYRLATGIAISRDGGNTFSRISKEQALPFNDMELFFRSGSFVLKTDTGYDMWYVAGNSWIKFNNRESPSYDLYKITSEDGISWPASGQVVLRASELADAFAIGRPWVVKSGTNDFELYFSYRKKSIDRYRLGHAVSTNGNHWSISSLDIFRDTEPLEFELDMVCYSSIWKSGSHIYMFYNGDDLGQAGVALARSQPLND